MLLIRKKDAIRMYDNSRKCSVLKYQSKFGQPKNRIPIRSSGKDEKATKAKEIVKVTIRMFDWEGVNRAIRFRKTREERMLVSQKVILLKKDTSRRTTNTAKMIMLRNLTNFMHPLLLNKYDF